MQANIKIKSMKKIIVLSFSLLLVCFVHGQGLDEAKQAPAVPASFIGLSTGINNYVGLAGVNVEVGIANNVSGYAGVGLGSWGIKSTAAVNYYAKGYPQGVAYSLGYSYSTGADNVPLTLETEDNEEVIFNLHPAHALNASLYYHWLLGKIVRIHLQAGYSLQLNPEAYTADVSLSNDTKMIMQMMQPGGIILGLGFSIGL